MPTSNYSDPNLQPNTNSTVITRDEFEAMLDQLSEAAAALADQLSNGTAKPLISAEDCEVEVELDPLDHAKVI